MKTSTLTAALLDYWTGRAEGIEEQYLKLRRVQRSDELICVLDHGEPRRYDPSTNPALGWSIIDRDGIEFQKSLVAKWKATCFGRHHSFGDTHLIAAMRAKVASVFGDEVPDIELPT